MNTKSVSGYTVVNYGVNRGAGRKTEHKNGQLRIKADYDAPGTHDKIMAMIRRKNPGWCITGFAPAKPLAAKTCPSVDDAALGKSLAGATEVKYLYAVMKAQPWSSIKVIGYPITPPAEGPHRFIPMFYTREQAVAWCGGDDTHVAQMSTH